MDAAPRHPAIILAEELGLQPPRTGDVRVALASLAQFLGGQIRAREADGKSAVLERRELAAVAAAVAAYNRDHRGGRRRDERQPAAPLALKELDS